MIAETRRLKLLADAVTLGSIIFLVAWLLFYALNDFVQRDILDAATNVTSYLSFATVGLLIVQRQPRNLIGWICAAIGFFALLGLFADEFTRYPHSDRALLLPLREFLAWTLSWTWIIPVMSPTILIPALFPDGKPSSRRMEFVVRIGLVTMLTMAVLSSLSLDDSRAVLNPLGSHFMSTVANVAGVVLFPLWILLIVSAVGSSIVRFHRARGQLRLQMKWFASATVVLLITALANDYVTRGDSNALFGVGVTVLALSIGVAILRHRLYDIDRIVNRTLVYGLLTATLALLYAGLVVGLQAALDSLSGGSDFAVVITTLVVAALFLPVRRRIQLGVDKRFNRRHYDAEHTVEAFAARLRQEVDLDTLRYELLSLVDETMQPAGASLWLREPS